MTACTGKALDVMRAACEGLDSRIYVHGRDFSASPVSSGLGSQTIEACGFSRRAVLKTALLGGHQAENLSCALAAIRRLQDTGTEIPEDCVSSGIRSARVRGRLEIFRRPPSSPFVILDVAHNPGAMECLSRAVSRLFGGRRVILVIGVSSDKDIAAIMKAISPVADVVIATEHSYKARSASPEAVAREAKKHSGNVCVRRDVGDAMRLALSSAGAEDVILVTGSFFTVGDAMRFFGEGHEG
jgi:dihydrofolate synthase/folylpolyglutamate synthase